MFFSCVAYVRSAFLTGYPAAKLGVVVDGGFFNVYTISVAAWWRKSIIFILGHGVS